MIFRKYYFYYLVHYVLPSGKCSHTAYLHCIFSFFHFLIVIYIDNAFKIPSGKCSHTTCLYIVVVCVYASAFCRRKIIFFRTSVAREKEKSVVTFSNLSTVVYSFNTVYCLLFLKHLIFLKSNETCSKNYKAFSLLDFNDNYQLTYQLKKSVITLISCPTIVFCVTAGLNFA